jgi:N-acetylneuraminate synthase
MNSFHLNNMKDMTIGGRQIGLAYKPFVIAELSGNHNQQLALALKMIDAAAETGVDAIKLQSFTADSITLDCDQSDFLIQEKNSLWYGQRLYDLYEKASTPYEWHETLFNHAKSLGLLAFSSPFDENAVDFLESLNVPCYKIASFELTHIPLIKKAASTGKPLIISTGMGTAQEIEDAVLAARTAGCKELILLKCTSTYPAEPANTNLNTLADFQQRFDCQIGLSDHTAGVGASVAAVALGATVIEKHFVLDRSAGGVDAAFSLEPDEFKMLVTETDRAWQAMGSVVYGGSDAENKSKQYRRSIYVSQDIEAGDILTPDNIRVVRPALGLAPKHWDDVLGKCVNQGLAKGTPLSWEQLK